MKRVFLLCAMLAAAGCATERGASTRHAMELEPGLSAYALDLLEDKLKANGAALFCEQEGYVGCYGITTQACMEELAPKTEPCFARAEAKYGAMTSSNDRTFVGYFVSCMLFDHVAMHSENAAEIMDCMKDAGFDQKRGLQSLMK